MIIKFNRRSIRMGDDVMNGVYKIDLPDDAAFADLVDVALHGGFGNTWPIPSLYPWLVYSNIGVLARTADNKAQPFFVDNITVKDNNDGKTRTAYNATFTQTPEENTFSFHLPDEAYEKMFGYIVLWISNKPRYNFGGTVTITPIYKKIPHTLKIENGTATLDPSRGSNTEITAAEGDLVYLYGKKPDDGNYFFTGWTLDGDDI